MERNRDKNDINPYRYCCEYYDRETNQYYLRARYYNPQTGRFTQEDTHWGPKNSIYGDKPEKIYERKDSVTGEKRSTYLPDTSAIKQSGNLYSYCMGNPVSNTDPTGNIVSNIIGALIGAGLGALIGLAIANYFNLHGWVRAIAIAGGALLVGIAGWFAGPVILQLLKPIVMKAIAAGTLIINKATQWIADALGIVTQKVVDITRNATQLFNRFSSHIFTAEHGLDQIENQREFFDQAMNKIQALIGQAQAGSNQIYTSINGINVTIRFYYNNGALSSIDIFTGWATRIIGKLLK